MRDQLAHLESEANELMAIFVTIVSRTKSGMATQEQR